MKLYIALTLALSASAILLQKDAKKAEAPAEYLLPKHPLAEKPNQRNRICDAHHPDNEGCKLQLDD